MTDDAQTLREIAERVERLTGPSPQIDAEIFAVAVYRRDRLAQHPLRYTASVDAALTLVPEGWHASVNTVGWARCWASSNTRNNIRGVENETGPCATPAIALTGAALRALAASQEQRRG